LFPQVGDRFTEFYSFWVYVLKVTKKKVTVIEANSPCVLPKDGKIWIGTRKEFYWKYAYKSIPGFWVSLVDQENDVAGWIREKNKENHNAKKEN